MCAPKTKLRDYNFSQVVRAAIRPTQTCKSSLGSGRSDVPLTLRSAGSPMGPSPRSMADARRETAMVNAHPNRPAAGTAVPSHGQRRPACRRRDRGCATARVVALRHNEPARVARLMVERGFTPHYDYALQTLQELPYGVWRDHDPEDTMR